MKSEQSVFHCLFRYTSVFALLLFVAIGPTTNTQAQKLPPVLDTGEKDPSGFNKASLQKLKDEYEVKVKGSDADKEEAKQLRNRLIGIGVDQIDAMFSSYVKNERKNRERFQFILDFLEIGSATAISLTKGARAKTVISEGLGALQATRTSLNKNFQLLERQVLINKMGADRATQLTAILSKRNLSVTQYFWEDAAVDLRAYRAAGTLDHALSSLSSDVGREKSNAEDKLREVKDKPITTAATKDDLIAAESAFKVEDKLETDLGDTTKKSAALTTLQKIVAKLTEDKEVADLLKAKGILATTADGMAIINALDDIKENATIFNRRDLVRKVNLVIADVGNQR